MPSRVRRPNVPVELPIVLVEWEDAWAKDAGETWVHREPAPGPWKPYVVQSCGFLLEEHPEGVVLTESLTPELTGQRQQIPRGMIRSVKVLQTPTRAKHATKPGNS